MRRVIFGILTSCICSSCSHKIYDTLYWQGNKAETAGNILEWSGPLRFYDEKSKINYNISNDDRNLYLCMNISDEAAKLKIIRGGMEFLRLSVLPRVLKFTAPPVQMHISLLRGIHIAF